MPRAVVVQESGRLGGQLGQDDHEVQPRDPRRVAHRRRPAGGAVSLRADVGDAQAVGRPELHDGRGHLQGGRGQRPRRPLGRGARPVRWHREGPRVQPAAVHRSGRRRGDLAHGAAPQPVGALAARRRVHGVERPLLRWPRGLGGVPGARREAGVRDQGRRHLLDDLGGLCRLLRRRLRQRGGRARAEAQHAEVARHPGSPRRRRAV
mmetsp:Transcript_5976/g.16044  ORF Transcript_5976/g.16044 Transcript_5976/m.16044 type:complete len:207 (+) Transcript_5976:922-1542(+)